MITLSYESDETGDKGVSWLPTYIWLQIGSGEFMCHIRTVYMEEKGYKLMNAKTVSDTTSKIILKGTHKTNSFIFNTSSR